MRHFLLDFLFLSTLPARGATALVVQAAECTGISIHAPREGSDWRWGLPAGRRCYFYPRSPRGERRDQRARPPRRRHFYPRSPRGERRVLPAFPCNGSYFYPRSPRGERPGAQSQRAKDRAFLSTLPARGATWFWRNDNIKLDNFYPRSPRGERHQILPRERPDQGDFYPRSPRGERPCAGVPPFCAGNFYPRSPRGERLALWPGYGLAHGFLSTLPARGATRGT